MDDNFYQDDFELFLKEQADSHRMYPSDGIWRNIHKQIHGDKKWPALTIAALLLLVATIAISVHFSPKPNIFDLSATTKILPALQPDKTPNKNIYGLHNNDAPVAYSNEWKKTAIQKKRNDEMLVANPSAEYYNAAVADQEQTTSVSTIEVPLSKLPLSNGPIVPSTSNSIAIIEENQLNADQVKPENEELNHVAAITHSHEGKSLPTVEFTSMKEVGVSKNTSISPSLLVASKKKKQSLGKQRLSFQVYLTPSSSFRRLKESKDDSKTNLDGPVALNLVADVSQVVKNKPGNGLEAGFGLMYNISPRLKIKTGLQFNMRQYNLEAFKSSKEVATITLQRGSAVDTLNSFAIYRTNTGYQETEIINRYYQVSIPVGVNWQVIGNDAVSLNVGASVQPTYQINQHAFVLSSDFKNYTQTEGMIRPWNVNSNLEAYLSFKVGNYHWQLGPQVRYQHLSTLIPQYSIKEHLWDYGLKLGVTKSLR